MNAPAATQKKKSLHPALLAALLLVLALTAWSMFGDEDDGVASARRAPARSATSQPGGSRGDAFTLRQAQGERGRARDANVDAAGDATGAATADAAGTADAGVGDASTGRRAQGEQSGKDDARGHLGDDTRDAFTLRQAQGEPAGEGGARDPKHLRAALQQAIVLLDERPAFPALSAQGGKAWASVLPPPPPAPKNLPPPPPQAPPFPYQWVGLWQEDDPTAAQLASSSASSVSAASAAAGATPVQMAVVAGPLSTWVVKPGDVIQGQWRVDAIDGSQMRVTYLPLSQSQTVGMRPSS